MRDIKQLHPTLQKKVEELMLLCEMKGYKIGISECVRTVAEQDALYAQGRNGNKEPKVTNAKGSTYQSMHQWGVAFDFYRNDGKGAYNNTGNFFECVGAIGKSIGLEWGGEWKTPDRPHFQLPNWGSTSAKLKKEYKTPDKFMATWEKAENKPQTKPQSYPVVKYGSENKYVKELQQLLTSKGYGCGKIDSIYGNKTREAVMAFQADHKDSNGKPLAVDGIVGAKTWAAIR